MSKYIRKFRGKNNQLKIISVKSQFERLKASFPNLIIEEFNSEKLSVIIKLKPDVFSKEYDVKIVYIGGFIVNVYIINEKLKIASNREVLPHVYNHEKQLICLYARTGGKWTRDQSIVSTIIPWASEWLYFYEFWLIDGEWRGGGHDEYATENIEEIKNINVK